MRDALYVPIVKAKRNDIASLVNVRPSKRDGIKPLLELAEYDRPDNDAILDAFCKNLSRLEWPHAPYVDLYSFLPDSLVSNGTNATVEGFRRIAARGWRVIPVYGFQRNDDLWGDLGAVAQQLGEGFCFRVDIDDLDDQAEQTWLYIIERSAEMGFAPNTIDIIVDLRFVGDSTIDSLSRLIVAFLGLQPTSFAPRSITIAGSSALKTVTDVPINGELPVLRLELLLWTHLQSLLERERVVAFGDYGVIHPDFSQSAQSPNANGKIRYTRGNSIHYFRGSRLFRPSNFSQYHILASRVVQSPQYRGPRYSVGDREIWECANRDERPGNLGTWVRIDQNHHVETTADQIRLAVRERALGARDSGLRHVVEGA